MCTNVYEFTAEIQLPTHEVVADLTVIADTYEIAYAWALQMCKIRYPDIVGVVLFLDRAP